MQEEEIKNILKCLEMDMLDNKQIEILLDYITNLQTIEREYSAVLSENAELRIQISAREEEYIKLQEENEYSNHCNEELRKKITNLEYKIERLEEDNKQLKKEIEIMEKYFELIIDLGYDYDGFNKEENLKSLIDELVRYASLGRVCNTTEAIYVNQDKKYNILNEELKGDNK